MSDCYHSSPHRIWGELRSVRSNYDLWLADRRPDGEVKWFSTYHSDHHLFIRFFFDDNTQVMTSNLPDRPYTPAFLLKVFTGALTCDAPLFSEFCQANLWPRPNPPHRPTHAYLFLCIRISYQWHTTMIYRQISRTYESVDPSSYWHSSFYTNMSPSDFTSYDLCLSTILPWHVCDTVQLQLV